MVTIIVGSLSGEPGKATRKAFSLFITFLPLVDYTSVTNLRGRGREIIFGFCLISLPEKENANHDNHLI